MATQLMYLYYITLVLYLLLITWLVVGTKKLKPFLFQPTDPKNFFSILIPFRNEAENLLALLKSIELLAYPKSFFEIILINDESQDKSEQIIAQFKASHPDLNLRIFQNIRTSTAPKKDALTTGISKAKFDWILTTDADCILPPKELNIVNAYIEKHQPFMIAGSVSYKISQTFINQFQYWNWISLTGFTRSGFGWKRPMICSGAHLIYEKRNALKIGLFKGNEHISSGDDVFLLQKMLQFAPEKVQFLYHPEAIVQTTALTRWADVLEQQKRWMSKTGSVQNILLQSIGLIVVFVNFIWILSVVNLLFLKNTTYYLVIFSIFKLILDAFYLSFNSFKGNKNFKTIYLIISILIYPFFSFTVSVIGFFFKYTWKNRVFKK